MNVPPQVPIPQQYDVSANKDKGSVTLRAHEAPGTPSALELSLQCAMMTLRLKALSETFTVGPTEEIVFRGDEIIIPGQAAAIVRFERDAWMYAGRRCNFLECRAFVILQFEDSNENVGSRIGPRSVLSVRNRYVFAGRERVAKLQPTKCWFQTGRHQSWPVLRVVLAGTRP